MSRSAARAIVASALELRRTHPHAPAMDALDLALQPHLGSSPDFEDGPRDLTDPDQPFGVLLREAFDPEFDGDPVRWERVAMAEFCDRYSFGEAP